MSDVIDGDGGELRGISVELETDLTGREMSATFLTWKQPGPDLSCLWAPFCGYGQCEDCFCGLKILNGGIRDLEILADEIKSLGFVGLSFPARLVCSSTYFTYQGISLAAIYLIIYSLPSSSSVLTITLK